MVSWKNLDTLAAYDELAKVAKVNLPEVMTGANGGERVKKYTVPMGAGLAYNYVAKRVDSARWCGGSAWSAPARRT